MASDDGPPMLVADGNAVDGQFTHPNGDRGIPVPQPGGQQQSTQIQLVAAPAPIVTVSQTGTQAPVGFSVVPTSFPSQILNMMQRQSTSVSVSFPTQAFNIQPQPFFVQAAQQPGQQRRIGVANIAVRSANGQRVVPTGAPCQLSQLPTQLMPVNAQSFRFVKGSNGSLIVQPCPPQPQSTNNGTQGQSTGNVTTSNGSNGLPQNASQPNMGSRSVSAQVYQLPHGIMIQTPNGPGVSVPGQPPYNLMQGGNMPVPVRLNTQTVATTAASVSTSSTAKPLTTPVNSGPSSMSVPSPYATIQTQPILAPAPPGRKMTQKKYSEGSELTVAQYFRMQGRQNLEDEQAPPVLEESMPSLIHHGEEESVADPDDDIENKFLLAAEADARSKGESGALTHYIDGQMIEEAVNQVFGEKNVRKYVSEREARLAKQKEQKIKDFEKLPVGLKRLCESRELVVRELCKVISPAAIQKVKQEQIEQIKEELEEFESKDSVARDVSEGVEAGKAKESVSPEPESKEVRPESRRKRGRPRRSVEETPEVQVEQSVQRPESRKRKGRPPARRSVESVSVEKAPVLRRSKRRSTTRSRESVELLEMYREMSEEPTEQKKRGGKKKEQAERGGTKKSDQKRAREQEEREEESEESRRKKHRLSEIDKLLQMDFGPKAAGPRIIDSFSRSDYRSQEEKLRESEGEVEDPSRRERREESVKSGSTSPVKGHAHTETRNPAVATYSPKINIVQECMDNDGDDEAERSKDGEPRQKIGRAAKFAASDALAAHARISQKPAVEETPIRTPSPATQILTQHNLKEAESPKKGRKSDTSKNQPNDDVEWPTFIHKCVICKKLIEKVHPRHPQQCDACYSDSRKHSGASSSASPSTRSECASLPSLGDRNKRASHTSLVSLHSPTSLPPRSPTRPVIGERPLAFHIPTTSSPKQTSSPLVKSPVKYPVSVVSEVVPTTSASPSTATTVPLTSSSPQQNVAKPVSRTNSTDSSATPPPAIVRSSGSHGSSVSSNQAAIEAIEHTPIREWTVSTVYDWVQLVTSKDSAEKMKSEEIDGKTLLIIGFKELRDELQIKLGPSHNIISALQNVRQKQESSGSLGDPYTDPEAVREIEERPIDSWTVDEVCEWVRLVSDSRDSANAIRDEEVDGRSLTHISYQDLRDCVVKYGPTIKLHTALCDLKKRMAPGGSN